MRIFYAFILCQRERKRHWVVHRTQPCVLQFHVVDHFILRGRRPWVSKHYSDCVRGKICFKEIVSNTRLDLNHSFFMHLVCELLTICRFLLIYIQYLFIALVYHIYLCFCLYLDPCIVPFALSLKQIVEIYPTQNSPQPKANPNHKSHNNPQPKPN